MNSPVKVVYNARTNCIGLLLDQFVLWQELCYARSMRGTALQCVQLESMEELSPEWTQIGEF